MVSPTSTTAHPPVLSYAEITKKAQGVRHPSQPTQNPLSNPPHQPPTPPLELKKLAKHSPSVDITISLTDLSLSDASAPAANVQSHTSTVDSTIHGSSTREVALHGTLSAGSVPPHTRSHTPVKAAAAPAPVPNVWNQRIQQRASPPRDSSIVSTGSRQPDPLVSASIQSTQSPSSSTPGSSTSTTPSSRKGFLSSPQRSSLVTDVESWPEVGKSHIPTAKNQGIGNGHVAVAKEKDAEEKNADAPSSNHPGTRRKSEKTKWIVMPPEELQATADSVNRPRLYSQSRGPNARDSQPRSAAVSASGSTHNSPQTPSKVTSGRTSASHSRAYSHNSMASYPRHSGRSRQLPVGAVGDQAPEQPRRPSEGNMPQAPVDMAAPVPYVQISRDVNGYGNLQSASADVFEVKDFGHSFGRTGWTGHSVASPYEERFLREREWERIHETDRENYPWRPRSGSYSGHNERGGYAGHRAQGANGFGRGPWGTFWQQQQQQQQAPPFTVTPPAQGFQSLPPSTPPPRAPPDNAGVPGATQGRPLPRPPNFTFPLDRTRYYPLGQPEYYLSAQNLVSDISPSIRISPPYSSTAFASPLFHKRPGISIPIGCRSEGSPTPKNRTKRTEPSLRQVIQIDVLPDDVLLEIFHFYVNVNTPSWTEPKPETEAWKSLVHVCRRWRNLVFEYPRRLDLKLHCTRNTPVKDTLDVWPALPLVVSGTMAFPLGTDNVIAALGQSNRVCQVNLWNCVGWKLEEILAPMQVPFPELTELHLSLSSNVETPLSSQVGTPPIIPDSFLDGSAPRLRIFRLKGISFPGLPRLLLSATHLVHLRLFNIPHSGYISPEAIVALLCALSSLETLSLGFQSPESRPDKESRSLPPNRSILPALHEFHFKGVTEYLEEFVTRIDTPQLQRMVTRFFSQIDFDFPRLAQFINCTPTLRPLDEAHVRFDEWGTSVVLLAGPRALKIAISCVEPDWQLSSIEQVCNSSLLPHSMVEDLYIDHEYWRLVWKNDTIEGTLWLRLLFPFTAVKNLYLSKESAPDIAAALQEPVRGRITEVLPDLQNIFVEGLEPSGPFQENIGPFIAARQLSDHPITISVWDKDSYMKPM